MRKKSLVPVLKRMGRELASLRVQKGYSRIKDFAVDHNLPIIQYWRIEKGKANVTIKTLINILTIHQMSIEEFFCLLQN